MSSVQHFVSPKLPTTLAGQTHVDLPGYDVWFCYVKVLYIIASELDVSKFEEALSRALQLYPHAAGQLRHIDRRWFIELANDAIPVDIHHKPEASSDSLLHGDWVVQHDISPFLNPEPIVADVINDSPPLLRIRLAFFNNNETSIGISWHHSLGDAIVLFRFMHTLSQFYQGLSPDFTTPSFKKNHFPTPSSSVVARMWPRIPLLHKTCDLSAFVGSLESFEHVTLRMDSRDVEDLCSVLSSRNPNGPSLSKQDCITAYLVAVLNHNRSDPVRRVRNSSSYRHVEAPFITENAASNLVLEVPAEIPLDMAGIATAIRNSLIQCRDPDYIHDWLSLVSHEVLEAITARKMFLFPGNDELTINSLTKIDWLSAHFGCPDGTRFHMDGPYKNAAKLSRSNPVKGVDGVWRACQSVDISIGVAPELKPKVLETFARGARYMLGD